MTTDEHDHAFTAGYWEDRYRGGEGTGRQDPSPSLVAEAAALPPGRALDAGCGRGADALWLAARGWDVTAVDVSATALAHGRDAARAAGPDVDARVRWEEVDLTSWSPGERRYDLVTSHFVHVPGPAEDLARRLASWVAPGGTLLVVGHAHGHGHPAGAQVGPEQVTAVLPADAWRVEVAEVRSHTLPRPDGAAPVVRQDVVVRAVRVAAGAA